MQGYISLEEGATVHDSSTRRACLFIIQTVMLDMQALAKDIQEARQYAVGSLNSKCYLQVHFLGPGPPDKG